MDSPYAVLILAAGRGTRMRSDRPKVLHTLAGKPLLLHLIDTCHSLRPDGPAAMAVVVGHQAEQVERVCQRDIAELYWVHQQQQLGTAHAVRCALPTLSTVPCQDVIILNGDTPLVNHEILTALLQQHRQSGCALTILTTRLVDPAGYGRVLRDEQGGVVRIVEEKDADPETRLVDEINSGIYCVDAVYLRSWMEQISNHNNQGEYYLTDMVALAVQQQVAVGSLCHADSGRLIGINSRQQLAQTEAILRYHLVNHWMEQGVTFIDPGSCWVAMDASIGPDSEIAPHVMLGPGVFIDHHCRIGAFCHISNSRLGAGTELLPFCHLDGCHLVGPNVVGPYARLRPGTVLEAHARVGNFCELKKAHIGTGSKINHLSYIGDTQMGGGVNVGAGTITCNYDGLHKHQTVIGDRVFIGSNTQLVAPVTVGAGAVIGAGSTITRPVPDDALALSRTPQRHIDHWASKRRQAGNGGA
ncbi:MAG: bifunctional UDP-N-acetylglucosamine diphosphorylase/glucosamine-1-phosphate N-acetyltransferase GlmU [Magnetococcales bacterium]|nr:bifunctional UDP-N-acetylglucosamine diphosphorylase/glucosamine-1-phosphate N-acetyltransferase GlmU [Magnetococcales bacterium]